MNKPETIGYTLVGLLENKKNQYVWFVDWKGDYHYYGGPYKIHEIIAIINHYRDEMGEAISRWEKYPIIATSMKSAELYLDRKLGENIDCLGYYILITGEEGD